MGLVVTGTGASCNTWNISQSVCFRNYSLDGVEVQNKRILTSILSLAQELRTTFGKMQNKVVVTSGQVVTILGASCNRFIAAELRQKCILHQFYILNFVFSYVMNTN